MILCQSLRWRVAQCAGKELTDQWHFFNTISIWLISQSTLCAITVIKADDDDGDGDDGGDGDGGEQISVVLGSRKEEEEY